MPVRSCTVRFRDSRGVEHSTEVLAETVMEAAALGMRAFRDQGMLDDDGVYELGVEVTTTTIHNVPIPRLRAWLTSNSHDPKTQAIKARAK